MAQNYLQFSAKLYIQSNEERKWLEKYLPLLENPEENVGDLLVALGVEAQLAGGTAFDSFLQFEEFVNEEYFQSYELLEMAAPKAVWFYAAEGGEPEMLLALVHIFYARFQREDYFEFSWAAYCDKLRIGEFDGGAGVACKDGYDIWTASGMVESMLEKLRAKGNSSPDGLLAEDNEVEQGQKA